MNDFHEFTTRVLKRIRSYWNELRSPVRIRLRTDDGILLAKRLALYLRSGVPIAQALALMQEDAATSNSARVLEAVAADVNRGLKLSSALSQFPRVYGTFHANLIAIGEASGTLPENLHYLAELLTRRKHLRQKVLSAMVYPGIIMVGTILVSGFLVFYAFPKILPLLKGFHTKLPFTTRLLIGLYSGLTRHALFLGALLACVCIGILYLWHKPGVRKRAALIQLHIPLLNSLSRSYYLASIFRTLATLLQSGIRLEAALALTADGLSASMYRESLNTIRTSVLQGSRVSTHVRAYPSLYPSTVRQLIALGEATGRLRESCSTIAEIYEERLDELTRTLSVLVEPALMIGMGCVVGFVALAIITPIYGLTQNLNVH